ncbi:MAG: hypothetical protein FJ290_23245 [Planctomycetes bacterium]|nr:hypothetical protein [Planctomycetota bacterium]
MTTRGRQIAGPLALLLAAACLAGCGGSGRGLTAYRDPEIALPAAKTGVKSGSDRAPKGDLCIINIRRDGSVWTRPGDTPSAPNRVPRLISKAHAGGGCLVLRCDRSARWDSVEPLLIVLAKAGVRPFWLCVDAQGEAALDCKLHKKDPPGTHSDYSGTILVGIRCFLGAEKTPAPSFFVEQSGAVDWDRFCRMLQQLAETQGSCAGPVILCIGDDVPFGWVIRVMDQLRGVGLGGIWFHEPHPERIATGPMSSVDPPSSTPVIGIPYRQKCLYRGHLSSEELPIGVAPELLPHKRPMQHVPMRPRTEPVK